MDIKVKGYLDRAENELVLANANFSLSTTDDIKTKLGINVDKTFIYKFAQFISKKEADMNKEEFLKKLEVELKIRNYSPYTIRNYRQINNELLNLIKKPPEAVTRDDVKL